MPQALDGNSSPNLVGNANSSVQNAHKLISGYEWGSGGSINVSFSFLKSVPSYYSGGAAERDSFSQFTTQMKDATRAILNEIERFSNIRFTEKSGVGDITFGRADLPGAAGWAYYPDQGNYSGDVWIDNNYNSFYLLAHEIGHALGLKHTFEAGLNGAENTGQYSVMAYGQIANNGNPASYMLYDIAALQKIYGTNNSGSDGNDSYVITSGDRRTIWDSGGNDTLDLSGVTSDSVVTLKAGAYSSIGAINNFAIAFNTKIENVVGGSGNDTFYGNSSNNIISGNAGNDTLYGSSGNDTLDGGTGIDTVTYSVNLTDLLVGIVDAVTLTLNYLGSTDTLISIENFIFNNVLYGFNQLVDYSNGLDVTGIVQPVTITGGSGKDKLFGSGGNDTIYGLGGKDKLLGGDGDDILYGGSGKDKLSGGLGNDNLNGGSGKDKLRGNDGDDILYGGGGKDKLYGDGGNDIFVLDATSSKKTQIKDFDALEDRLDISDILQGYDPLSDAISDFLQVTSQNGKTYVSVDETGAGDGALFEIVAQVNGLQGYDAQTLEDQNIIII